LNQQSLFAQLKERRVIRAAIIYVALLWVALQAADLLAGAGMLSDRCCGPARYRTRQLVSRIAMEGTAMDGRGR